MNKNLKSLLFLLLLTPLAFSNERTQAYKLFKRLSGGVPPTTEQLNDVEQKLKSGDKKGAAAVAIGTPTFINITAKEFAKAFFDMDNKKNIRSELSDGSATIMGMIRDDVPFNQILSADITYSLGGANTRTLRGSNNHYSQAENNLVDANQNLQQGLASQALGIDPSVTAGIFTSREFARIFIEAGTNRAPIKWVAEQMFCSEIEAIMDPNRPSGPKFVGRDVFLYPTGGIEVFKGYCMGCHSVMGAARGAFAYYDYRDGQLQYNPAFMNQRDYKYAINTDNNPNGYTTVDDSWVNTLTEGVTAGFNFYGAKSGRGAKSYGTALTQSEKFSECMATKVFEKICYHKPGSDSEKALIKQAASNFSSTHEYKMKKLFEDVAAGTDCYNE